MHPTPTHHCEDNPIIQALLPPLGLEVILSQLARQLWRGGMEQYHGPRVGTVPFS